MVFSPRSYRVLTLIFKAIAGKNAVWKDGKVEEKKDLKLFFDIRSIFFFPFTHIILTVFLSSMRPGHEYQNHLGLTPELPIPNRWGCLWRVRLLYRFTRRCSCTHFPELFYENSSFPCLKVTTHQLGTHLYPELSIYISWSLKVRSWVTAEHFFTQVGTDSCIWSSASLTVLSLGSLLHASGELPELLLSRSVRVFWGADHMLQMIPTCTRGWEPVVVVHAGTCALQSAHTFMLEYLPEASS